MFKNFSSEYLTSSEPLSVQYIYLQVQFSYLFYKRVCHRAKSAIEFFLVHDSSSCQSFHFSATVDVLTGACPADCLLPSDCA